MNSRYKTNWICDCGLIVPSFRHFCPKCFGFKPLIEVKTYPLRKTKKRLKRLKVGDRTYTVKQLSDLTGLSTKVIHGRLGMKWPIERIISTPIRKYD